MVGQIRVIPNGPLKVTKAEILVGDAVDFTSDTQAVYLCRCGLSKNKPFCDGSHKGVFKTDVEEAKNVVA